MAALASTTAITAHPRPSSYPILPTLQFMTVRKINAQPAEWQLRLIVFPLYQNTKPVFEPCEARPRITKFNNEEIAVKAAQSAAQAWNCPYVSPKQTVLTVVKDELHNAALMLEPIPEALQDQSMYKISMFCFFPLSDVIKLSQLRAAFVASPFGFPLNEFIFVPTNTATTHLVEPLMTPSPLESPAPEPLLVSDIVPPNNEDDHKDTPVSTDSSTAAASALPSSSAPSLHPTLDRILSLLNSPRHSSPPLSDPSNTSSS